MVHQWQEEAANQKRYPPKYSNACNSIAWRCSKRMWNEYDNNRHVRTLKGVVKLHLKIRRCQDVTCERYRIAYRPEQEGKWALPQQEFV